MKAPEENENSTSQENTHEPAKDVETVGNKNDNKEPVPNPDKLEQKKPAAKLPENENTQDPANDIETVTSKNDNTEPIPDQDQLEQKK